MQSIIYQIYNKYFNKLHKQILSMKVIYMISSTHVLNGYLIHESIYEA